MEKLRIGFIGTGGIAQAHLRALQGVEEIDVVAVADIIEEKVVVTAERWSVPQVYTDHRRLLAEADIEAVAVTTHNQDHALPTIDALRAGKHVLVEKPMAATLSDATAIVRAGRESDKMLMVGLVDRFDPKLNMAKSLVDQGCLGDIYYAESVLARRSGNPGRNFIYQEAAGIGATADIGVYALYNALYLMGWPKPVSVSGIANNKLSKSHEWVMYAPWSRWEPEDMAVEDFGVAWVRFETGAVLVFKTCWMMHMDSLGSTFFLGTEGGLKLDPLTLYRQEAGVLVDSAVQGIPARGTYNLFREEHLAFARAIRQGDPTPVPAEEMLITNVIIDGLLRSAEAGGAEVPVSVPVI